MNLSRSDDSINQMIDNIFSSSISDFLGTDFTRNHPAVNIIEGQKDFLIEIAAPGFSKKDFQIELKENRLNVGAEIKSAEKSEEDHYTRREFNYSSFERSFQLPETVDADSIKATYKEGLLKISLNKIEPTPEIVKSVQIS